MEKKLRRFVVDETTEASVIFMPFAQMILRRLARLGELTFVMDGSAVGRGCMTLMVGAVFKNRVLPSTWLVYQGKKGHTTAQRHIMVGAQLPALLPQNAKVNGEYDNAEMLEFIIHKTNWKYIVRTPKSSWLIAEQEQAFQIKELQVKQNSKIGILNDGLEALTIARLAKVVDAVVGTLYRYFPSKDSLLLPLQLHALEEFAEALSSEFQNH